MLIANVSLPGGRSDWSSSLFDSIFTRLQSLPGVKDTGAIDSLFDLGPTDNLGLRTMEGHIPEPGKQWTALTWDTVRGDYFQAIGAQLLRGRYFSDQDGLHSPLVAIIDESAARRYWPGRAHSVNDSKVRIVAGRMTTGSPLSALCGTYRHMASSDDPHLIFTNGTGRAETPLPILWCEPRVIRERLRRRCAARFAV